MRSLYKKQSLITAVALLISFTLMAAAMMVATYNYFVEREQTQLATTAEAAANLTRAYSITGDLATNWELRMSISLSAQVSESYLLICDTAGQVVLTSDGNLLNEYVGKTVPDVAAYSVRNLGGYTAFNSLNGIFPSRVYIHGSPIYSADGELNGMVFATSGTQGVIRLFLRLAYIFLVIAVLTLIIAFVITSTATRRQVKPLKEMAAVAGKFGMGDYSARVADTGRKDEIGELTRAFNSMADSIEQSENRRNEFIANISHELRTPMTTIGGFADGMLDGTIPPREQGPYLQTISDEVKRLSRLVSRMLEISRLQARLSPSGQGLQKERFNISELLRVTLLGMEQDITARGLDVDAQLGEQDVFVLGEKDSITQVVYNLLGNAAKFARQGTALGVRIETTSQKALITFSNQGKTIAPEELDCIFERFHKSDASRSEDKEGLGLGLYIVKSIMNAHGEQVTVTSREGLTSFTVSLPLAKA